jgi:hypothetical protein
MSDYNEQDALFKWHTSQRRWHARRLGNWHKSQWRWHRKQLKKLMTISFIIAHTLRTHASEMTENIYNSNILFRQLHANIVRTS